MIPGVVKIGDEVFFVVYDHPDFPSAFMVRMKVDSITYQGTTHERVQGETLGLNGPCSKYTWDELAAHCWPTREAALSRAVANLKFEFAKLQGKAFALGFKL